MRIDLVSGATYFPSRVVPREKLSNEQRIAGNNASGAARGGISQPGEELTPSESVIVQRLFGDFKPKEQSDLSSSVRPGQFVDITV